jgi:hypothetical protein
MALLNAANQPSFRGFLTLANTLPGPDTFS